MDSVFDGGIDPGPVEVQREEWAKPIVRVAHSAIRYVLEEF
jgi:hypothetical protein